MELLRKFCLVGALSLLGVNAFATDVQVDDGSMLFSTQIASIDIDPNSNLIKIVTVAGNYTIEPQQGNPEDPTINLLVNGATSTSVNLGTNVDVTWNVTNALSCSTSNGTSAWQAVNIVPDVDGNAAGSLQVTVDFESTILFDLDCTGEVGTNPASDTVSITGVAVGQPSVTLLVEGGDSVSVPENSVVNISWVVSNSNFCSTSGGNAAWQAHEVLTTNGGAVGNIDITVDFAVSTEFVLDCNDNTSNASDLVTVNVDTTCGLAPLDTGLTASQRAALIVPWEGIFGEFWPDPFAASQTIAISTARYMAIKFNSTGASPLDGGMRSIAHPSTNGTRIGAISECPGDFDDHVADNGNRSCEYRWTTGGALRWTTAPSPQIYECELEVGKTYYLNITFTDGINPGNDSCFGTPCRTTIDVWHN